jgi:hypothetical protein
MYENKYNNRLGRVHGILKEKILIEKSQFEIS